MENAVKVEIRPPKPKKVGKSVHLYPHHWEWLAAKAKAAGADASESHVLREVLDAVIAAEGPTETKPGGRRGK